MVVKNANGAASCDGDLGLFKIFAMSQMSSSEAWNWGFVLLIISFQIHIGMCFSIDLSLDDTSNIQRESNIPFKSIDPVDTTEPTNALRNFDLGQKRPLWAWLTLQEAKKIAAPSGFFRASQRSQFPIYVVSMSRIIDFEPCSYEEASNQQVRRDAMTEE